MTEPDRMHLPDTPNSITRRIEHNQNLDIYVTVGFFETGIPGEVFVKIGKEGSTLAGLADWAAVLMSLMLQYHIPWERIARKVRHTNFEPINSEGKSIAHSIVAAVDLILETKGQAREANAT
jgi:ribonucleoside-diphosphate reductase alpha chain